LWKVEEVVFRGREPMKERDDDCEEEYKCVAIIASLSSSSVEDDEMQKVLDWLW
jgi:hypothetical protein